MPLYSHWYQVLLLYLLNTFQIPPPWPRHCHYLLKAVVPPSVLTTNLSPIIHFLSLSVTPPPRHPNAQTSFLLEVFRCSYLPPKKVQIAELNDRALPELRPHRQPQLLLPPCTLSLGPTKSLKFTNTLSSFSPPGLCMCCSL